MNGLVFLKAAYAVAWLTYLGYLGDLLAGFPLYPSVDLG